MKRRPSPSRHKKFKVMPLYSAGNRFDIYDSEGNYPPDMSAAGMDEIAARMTTALNGPSHSEIALALRVEAERLSRVEAFFNEQYPHEYERKRDVAEVIANLKRIAREVKP